MCHPPPPRSFLDSGRSDWLPVLVLLTSILTGCGRPASVGPDQVQAEDDPPTTSVTTFGDVLELFLEHPFPVAGRDTKVNVHLTVLKDGSPIRSGTLRVVTTGPMGKSNAVEQAAPRSPGIYGPAVVFPESGRNELALELHSDQARETLRIPVQVYADEDDARRAAESVEDEESAGAVPFLKEQQWKIGLITQPVARHDLSERLVVPGETLPAAGAQAVVTPPAAGRLLPPPGAQFPRVGEAVRAGQVVALIEPPLSGPQGVQFLANQAQIRTLQTELQARLMDIEVEIRTAQIDLDHARTIYGRTKSLATSEAVSQRQLDEAEHRLRLAEATHQGKTRLREPYERALKSLASMLGETLERSGSGGTPDPGGRSAWQAVRIPLEAPHTGTITAAQAVEGEFVEPSRALFTIINLDRLWVEARVSEFDLERVVAAPAADFHLAAHPGRRFPILGGDGGTLIDVGSVVDPQSRTVPVRYEVANPDHALRVGLLAEVAIETGRVERAVAVPEAAIVEEEGRPIAYVLLDGESFQKRDLELGLKDRGMVEVTKGLEAGERVVIRGGYALRLASVSGVIPAHGHAH
jgi:cobalt-zinc-cadmium efflux system membrane fusion protein